MKNWNCLCYLLTIYILLLCTDKAYLTNIRTSENTADQGYFVPFSFPRLAYTITILPDIGPNQYVLPNEPQMGVPEPFNGQPTGSVTFSIIGNEIDQRIFETETVKAGGFYFLRLRTTYDSDFNTKKQSIYSFNVRAVFQSKRLNNRIPIRLQNDTRIMVNILDRNDNCPFFPQDSFNWTVSENATVFTPVGVVIATDADIGINGQIYYFLQSKDSLVPFRIDPRSGVVFPTKSLIIDRNKQHLNTASRHTTYFSRYEGLKRYSFKVIARHRGNTTHVSCDLVSYTKVNINVAFVQISAPNISAYLFPNVDTPGSAGTTYATIKAFYPDRDFNPLSMKLNIIEPEFISSFELVRFPNQAKWLLRLKHQFISLSLSSHIVLTLEVVDKEFSLSHLPFSSRISLDVPLLPVSSFRIHLPDQLRISVSEIAMVNSTIFIINPTLPFYVQNASFLFTETSGHIIPSHRNPIRITEFGAVIVSHEIDAELLNSPKGNFVEIPFTVADRNNILLSSMADSKLIIEILDFNEHDPVISNDEAEVSIVENLAVGSEVIQIKAYDPDFSKTRMSYMLYDEQNLPFNFSTTKPDSLILKYPLDAETMPAEFRIKVKVSDSGKPFPRSVVARYVIRIIDVNEFSPMFVEKSCEAWLAVGTNGEIQSRTPINKFDLGRFFAEDLDRDGSGTVKIRLATSTVSRPCFTVDSATGTLALECSNIGPPGSTVIVQLEAMDNERISESPFELKIDLVKQNPSHGGIFHKACQPSGIYEKLREGKKIRASFENRLFNFENLHTTDREKQVIGGTPILNIPTEIYIPENLPLGTPILEFSATFDNSVDELHQLIYGLKSDFATLSTEAFIPSAYQSFLLKNATDSVSTDHHMSLVVAAPLDREIYSAFKLSIWVCLVLYESLCTQAEISIYIEDIPDVPPYIEHFSTDRKALSHAFSVSEDVAVGTAIGQVLAKDDNPHHDLRYFLKQSGAFKIHSEFGHITTAHKLDRETVSSHLLLIEIESYMSSARPIRSALNLYKLALDATPQWALVRTITTHVQVTLIDVNDNSPIFTSPGLPLAHSFVDGYHILMPIDLPENAYITTLRAYDVDEGKNSVMQYSLFGSESDKACFACDAKTGVVHLAPGCHSTEGGLRHGHVYQLTAWARDLGQPSQLTETNFHVRVVGLHLHLYPPIFEEATGLYHGKIGEGQPEGSWVLLTNGDPLQLKLKNLGGRLVKYNVVGGTGFGRFKIDKDGFILSTRKLDAECLPFSGGYWLEVYAEEHFESDTLMATDDAAPMHTVAEIFIQIIDENEFRPMPEAPSYRFHVAETTAAGSIVATITGSDADVSGSQLHHRIVSGDPDGYFIINSATGQLATSERPIDRETSFRDSKNNPISEAHLVVSLTDSGISPLSTNVSVVAVIDDVNDNTPRFQFTSPDCECYRFYHSLKSSTDRIGFRDESVCVGRVFAVDPDGGINGTVIYSSTSDSDNSGGGFVVEPLSGLVCAPLNATGLLTESPVEFVLRVNARDSGSPFRETAASVSVRILLFHPSTFPVKETDLRFKPTASLPESIFLTSETPVGSHLCQVELSEGVAEALRANPSIRWAFELRDFMEPSPFAIVRISNIAATVYLHSQLNSSYPSSIHEITVTATDGTQFVTGRTLIHVESLARESPTLDASRITAGSNISMNVTQFGSDSREQSGGESGLRISLVVLQNSLVGSLVCRLLDAGSSTSAIVFSIVTADQESSLLLFSLDPNTGEVLISHALDYKTARQHHLIVSVSFANSSATSYISLVIRILEVNEQPPMFPQDTYVFTASSSTTVGTAIGRVSAFDPDFMEDSEALTYAITAGDNDDLFTIEPNTGIFRLKNPFFGITSKIITWPVVYHLTVAAIDSAEQTNHTGVWVHFGQGVGAVSAAPLPRFKQALAHRPLLISVLEGVPPGFVIESLTRHLEPTIALLSPRTFFLVQGDPFGLFGVTSDGGLLVTLQNIDRETQGDLHRLVIAVRGIDVLPAHMTETINVEVHVLDINDNNPSILGPLWLSGVISETARPGSLVMFDNTSHSIPTPLQIPSFDSDAGMAGEVTYHFVGETSPPLFSLESHTGHIRLKGKLDREVRDEHLLTIAVMDGGQLFSSAWARVRVRVSDVNDSPPKFVTPLPSVVTISLPTFENALVARFKVLDPDLNDTVFFVIKSGNEAGYFSIGRETGALRVTQNLATVPSSINERQFQLQLAATDSNSLHSDTHNLSVFLRPPNSVKWLLVDPPFGLNVSLAEHYTGPRLFLGQLQVRNSPPGLIFRFQLANASADAFFVDEHTGSVFATGRNSSMLDKEISPIIFLRVIVRDYAGGLDRSGEALIRVHLKDINDHAPEFVNQPYHATFCVKEMLPQQSGGKLGETFNLESSPHILSKLRQACQSNYFKVKAIDPDSGANGQITYRIITIQPRAEPPLLSVDPTSGRLSLTRTIPADWAGRRLRTVVQATDGGQKSSTAVVEVELSSRLGPRFAAGYYRSVVREGAPLGESVTSVEAFSASGSSLLYRLVGVFDQQHRRKELQWEQDLAAVSLEDSPFSLDFSTGVIRVATPLDYEAVPNYELLIEALDTITGNLARVNVYINVTDENDIKPAFSVPMYQLNVSEAAPIGSLLTTANATDSDSGVNGQIRFHLQPFQMHESKLEVFTVDPGQSVDGFSVNAETGELRLTQKLDLETNSQHTFWLVATDLGTPSLATRIPVTVFVLDTNDNEPRFDEDLSTVKLESRNASLATCQRRVSVSNNIPTDAFVVRVAASDLDASDVLTYRILPQSAAHSFFRVASNNGSVYWRSPQTDESKQQLRDAILKRDSGLPFKIEVSDGIHQAECSVVVTILPSNQFGPLFPDDKTLNVSIPESVQVGTLIASLPPAEDLDVGQFGLLNYTLISGDSNRQFKVNASTGAISLANPLDREKVDFYSLTVMASDQGGLSDFITIQIHVSDVNDNAPVMQQTRYEITLLPSDYTDESWLTFSTTDRVQRANMPLPIHLKADDPDLGVSSSLTYRLLPQFSNSSFPFTVHPQSGDVKLTRPIKIVEDGIGDRSKMLMSFFVMACDADLERPLCSKPVEVIVHLANKEGAHAVSIDCSAVPVSEGFHKLKDQVAGCRVVNSSFQGGTWSLVGTPVAQKSFQIDSTTGVIHATHKIDYEIQPMYLLIIQYRVPKSISDLGVPLVVSTNLELSITDVNDCSPIFETKSSVLSIPEDMTIGTKFFQLSAFDCDAEDNNILTFSLRFKSDEAEQVHNARHNLGLISGIPFSIDSSHWLTVSKPIDREMEASYELEVIATDTVGHTTRISLIVNLLDVNDCHPEWVNNTLYAEVHIEENSLPTSAIFQLAVTDADESTIPALLRFYAVDDEVSSSHHSFSVSPSGGVFLRRTLDAEEAGSHVVRVKATDGLLTTQQPFILNVIVDDVDDNLPVCQMPEQETSVLESVPAGTQLFNLNATDNDVSEEHSKIIFDLIDGDDTLFTVEPNTGRVLLANDRKLDFELQKKHTLKVEAKSPNGGKRGMCRFTLLIHVLDINDNSPVIKNVLIEPVPENAPLGSLVGKVHAVDADSVDTHRLEYTIQSPPNASFSIDKRTGLLRVIQTLDRETLAEHSLIIAVADSSLDDTTLLRHTATSGVNIRLLDVNDSPPRFVDPRPQTSVSELIAVGTVLMQVKAVSLDEGENSVIHYRLLEHQPEFSLNASTGELFLSAALDYERAPRYFLTIEARDGGTPPLSSTTVATVNVVDVNDNRPQFIGQEVYPRPNGTQTDFTKPLGVFVFEIPENSPIGMQIGRLTAADPDFGKNGRLTYDFCQPNDFPNISRSAGSHDNERPTVIVRNLFRIGREKGELSLLFSPDREQTNEYRFEVCVSDNGTPAFSVITDVRVVIRDTNDCQPQFEKPNYAFFVQVDRSGNVVSINEQPSEDKVDEQFLLGSLAVTDVDAAPNAGPFKCKLSGASSSWSNHWSSKSSDVEEVEESDTLPSLSPAFIVRSVSGSSPSGSSVPMFFHGLESHQTGYCSIYAASNLPLGSQSLVVRAHDNGLTVLRSSVTLTVHVTRQSDLPPEIVSSNATLSYYRGLQPSVRNGDGGTGKSTVLVARVTVMDRTVYDRLVFELLPETRAASHFQIDRYDGSIRVQHSNSDDDVEVGPRPSTGSSSFGGRESPLAFLEPNLKSISPLAQLNPGVYPLRVRVTNDTLSVNDTIFINVVAITEDMLEAACVIHISDISPNEFFIQHFDKIMKTELASNLLQDVARKDKSSTSQEDNIYLLSAQHSSVTSSSLSRRPRQTVSSGGGVDLLVSVYDPLDLGFIGSWKLVQRVHAIQSNLSSALQNHQVHAFNSLCAQKKCESGQCVTHASLDPSLEMNVFEVHGMSHVSPGFRLVPTCECPRHFGGPSCDQVRNVCGTITCKSPRICVPPWTPGGEHACVCPPPWTGANCELLARPLGDSKACFTETCFQQRENGPLQFTGGSFAHWQIIRPNEYHLRISFAIRTRQQVGPVFKFKWSALHAFQIRLIDVGTLAVSPIDLSTGLSTSDWLIANSLQLGDGQWHNVRFLLSATGHFDSAINWWTELTVDGVHSYFTKIDWAPGDTESQDLILGVDIVHGFRPLAHAFYPDDWVSKQRQHQQEALKNEAAFFSKNESIWPQFNYSEPPPVFRSGFVGCVKNVYVNRVKPPYQLGLSVQQAVLSAQLNRKRPDDQETAPVIQVLVTRNLEYQCSASATFDGSCAYAPCQNGGACNSHRALTYSKLERGASAVEQSDYNCDCQASFQGPRCARVQNPCDLQPCQNGAGCQILNVAAASNTAQSTTAYRCVCLPGFSGTHCELFTNSSYCDIAQSILTEGENVCMHGARCKDSPSGPICRCVFGWRGARCEHDLNECILSSRASVYEGAPDPLCNPYGTRRGVCTNLPGSFHCNCSLGYAGRNCQIQNLTPLKPDSNALGLTPMHGYIIASIFALVFLLAVVTVIILTCCFRRRSFYTNGGNNLPWEKSSAHQQKSFRSNRMLPDGDSTYSPSRTGFGPASTISGGYVSNPGYLFTPGAPHRQSIISPVPVMMDENGQLITLKRPCSMVGGDGVPMMFLGPNGAPSPSASMIDGQNHPQLVRYLAASTASVRRCNRFQEDGGIDNNVDQGSYGIHMTPHLSMANSPTLHPGMAMMRPGSSNTVASDRISLGSGSDRFSVQSDSKRVKQQQQQPAYYMYPVQSGGPSLLPQTASVVRRQHMMQTKPQQPQLISLAPSAEIIHYPQQHQVVYRPWPPTQQQPIDAQERASLSGQSINNLSSARSSQRLVDSHRLSLFGIPERQPTDGGIRPAASLWWGPPIEQASQWPPGYHPANHADFSNPISPEAMRLLNPLNGAESALSLLPPIGRTLYSMEGVRNSLYRKSNKSINDLRRCNRIHRHNPGSSQSHLSPALKQQVLRSSVTGERPRSAYIPIRREENSELDRELAAGVQWEHMNGSSSAFVIAEPRGQQDFAGKNQPSENGVDDATDSPCRKDGTLKPNRSSQTPNIDQSEFSCLNRPAGDGQSNLKQKLNGSIPSLLPRPSPPNMLPTNVNSSDFSSDRPMDSENDTVTPTNGFPSLDNTTTASKLKLANENDLNADTLTRH